MIVKDRAAPGIGAITSNELHWATIDWRTVKQKVKNLRSRIYRATQAKQWNKVRSLMKLMLRSRVNLLESIRRITQLNAGKKTPGIDGRTATTAWERERLIREMSDYQPWKVKPAKRVYIPKAHGKKRPLGIICLADRVAQAIVKNALEPSWEARFETAVYGFRGGRSAHDALGRCWHSFRSNMPNQWALDADIQSAFDQVNHAYLMKKIGKVPGSALILRWLKAGYIDQAHWHASDQGTGQGSVISPLLMNIALHGLDTWLSQFKRTCVYTYPSGRKQGKKYQVKRRCYYLTKLCGRFCYFNTNA